MSAARSPEPRVTTVVVIVAIVLLASTALLIVQNASLRQRLDNNTLAIENLSSQIETMTSENSELISQNRYLEDALSDYQEKVRSYQSEIYEMRRRLNLTTDNTTILVREKTVTIIAPAVMAETYRDRWGIQRIKGYVGIATNLTLEAVPGHGRVLVNTVPPMGEVFQDTAVTAKETAEKITGTSLIGYDLVFSVEAPDVVPSVDGPSAGAAMTLMILSLLEEKHLDSKVSVTGTISPDGTIGPIGGVVQKAEAAEKAGANVFCIPKGNEFTTVAYQKEVAKWPWTITRTVYEEVETKALIEERTDLTVHIVDDILDLARIATYKED